MGVSYSWAGGNSIDGFDLHLAGTSAHDRIGVDGWHLGGSRRLFQSRLGAVYLTWVIGAVRSKGIMNRRLLLLWLPPLLIMTPWALRNLIVMGGLFPVRDNLGLELYVSFNDCAPYSFRENMRTSCIQNFHPNSSVEEALAVRSLGEYKYVQDRFRKAARWVSLHPARASAAHGSENLVFLVSL